MSENIVNYPEIDSYFAYLAERRWRCLWVISEDVNNDVDSALECAREICIQYAKTTTCLWISKDFIDHELVFSVSPHQLHTYLGMDAQFVYLDMRETFDANLFCMASGYVKAGGALVLMLPDMGKTPNYSASALLDYPEQQTQLSARYVSRLWQQLKNSKHVIWSHHNKNTIIPDYELHVNHSHLALGNEEAIEPPYIHAEQKYAVELVKRCAQGHAKRPVVIYANRGRGKSTALGIAAAQLLKEGKQSIIVCAQHKRHVDVIFKTLIGELKGAEYKGNCFSHEGKTVNFFVPDELVASDVQADFLIIDEAATISVEQLKQLSQRYNRVAYATTVYGYEGTGQGFKQRFLTYLRDQFNTVNEMTIDEPARWGLADPLEQMTTNGCFLEAPLQYFNKDVFLPKTFFSLLNFRAIQYDDSVLSQLYALMLNAHYRTSPRDLQQLMDDENMMCFVLSDVALENKEANILALALIKKEGHLSSEICQLIVENKRRVKGHLMAQTIIKNSGSYSIGAKKAARISRIVAHPKLQRKGLASHLLANIRKRLIDEGYQYWGTSFGARESLIDFWHANAMKIIDLGLKKNNQSGEYSCLFVESLNDEMNVFTSGLSDVFYDQLRDQIMLNQSYRVELIYDFLKARNHIVSLSNSDKKTLARYLNDELSFESSFHCLKNIAHASLHNQLLSPLLKRLDWQLLINVFYYHKPLNQLVKQGLFKNRASLELALKKTLSSLTV